MCLPMCTGQSRIWMLVLLSAVFEGTSHTLQGKSDARALMRRVADLASGPPNIAKLNQDERRAMHQGQSKGMPQNASHHTNKTASPLPTVSPSAQKSMQTASPLPRAIPIPILAVESTEGHVFTLPGVPNKIARNLGLATRGKSRLELYTSWTRAQIAKDPDQLAIFVDGYNVVSGGCGDTDLRERYNELVHAGGDTSPIVVGAEFGDKQFGGKESNVTNLFKATVASQRAAVLKANHLKGDIYSDLVLCDGHACKTKPLYEFIDLGFVMGPVGKLHELFVGISGHKLPMKSQMKLLNFEISPSHTRLTDEEAAALYVLTRKNAVVLDYTGSLVLDLRGISRHSFLTVKHGELFNDVTKKTQCFVRGDGRSHGWAEELAVELRG